MKTKAISIIGAGHSGCALAAEYKHRGYDVCLYSHPDHANKLNAIKNNGHLTSSGNIQGKWLIDLLTQDLPKATQYSNYIILALPSYAQESLFEELAPHLQSHHKVINLNGNFSSYILHNLTACKSVEIYETNSAPHASRATQDGMVHIHGTKKFIPIASTTTNISASSQREIENLMPCALEWHDTPLSVSLQAYNGVLHPTPLILNTAWTEAQGVDYLFYKDGISPCVGKVIEKIDNERLEIANLYKIYNLRTTLQALNEIYGGNSLSISALAQESDIYDNILAPNNMCSRYITEDVPYILVPWYHLGKAVGYEAQTIKSVINMASIMHGEDYMQTGRNLDKLKLFREKFVPQKTLPILQKAI